MKKILFILILNSAFLILNSFCGVYPEPGRRTQNKNIDSLLTLLKTDKPDSNKVIHLNNLSEQYWFISNYEQALQLTQVAKELALKLGFTKGLGISYNNMGDIYWYKGNYILSADNYFNAIKIFEKLNDKIFIGGCYRNIGWVYLDQQNYEKAIEYFSKSLAANKELNKKNLIGISYSDIGVLYERKHNYEKALYYDFEALKMAEKSGDQASIAILLGNIGSVYMIQGNYTKALKYDLKSLEMEEVLGNINGIAMALSNIGSLYTKAGKFKKAEQYQKRANAINESIGGMDYLRKTEELLSQLYDTTGRYKEALIHYKKAIALKDTIFSQENKKQIVRKEMNFEFEKKEAATKATHDKEMAVAEAEKKKQQFILLLVSSFLLLVFLFAGFVFRSLRVTRKQKNIIELQKNEVSQQKEIVEKQKEKIVDSITYAKRIQQSILMEESEIQNYLPECFIYFQPKDIVSGDFYWCSKIDNKIIVAAVDCTGHGVPGAFMSMIGNTLLNQIVNEKHITRPSEILKLLNLGVYEALHQKKDGALSPDGMDIALCAIDYQNNEIQFAGAQNPLYVISENQMDVIKADIHGIGGGGMMAKLLDPMKIEYTNHIIRIKKGMSIYIFTDGYRDQFGGPLENKFGTKKFKELLLNSQGLSMQEQKTNLVSAHEEWKGSIVQIDDILVIGIRI